MYGLRHTGIYVRNLERMKAFYQEMFQLREESAGVESGEYIARILALPGAEVAVSKLRFEGGGLLELLEVRRPAVGQDCPKGMLWQAGQSHIAVTVDDVEAVRRRFQDRNLKCLSAPTLSPDGFAKVCFCQDPEGNYLELVEVLAMKKHSIGIMQGRLTPPRGRGIQFFPFDSWRQEFQDAKAIGLDEIEFIFDYDRYQDNPLWTRDGIAALGETVRETGVCVNAVCFDYFMRRPFFRYEGKERDECRGENLSISRAVCAGMAQLGIGLLEIPLVDGSSLKSDEDKEAFRLFLRDLIAEKPESIRIGLETDLPPAEFRAFLEQIGHPQVGANYDSGNSSGLGYDCQEEIRALGAFLFNVHIKDRQFHGPTMALGTGDAEFDKLFPALAESGYQGALILQAARGEDQREKETVSAQKRFVEDCLRQCR